MFSISMLPVFLRELASSRKIAREPEPALVMNDPAGVEAFDLAGNASGPIAPLYLLLASHVSQVLTGTASVLDLGCGSGQLISRIAMANPKIRFTAIDLSENMLNRAQLHFSEQHISNVKLASQDMTDLRDFASASFDAVISSLAFHHLPNERSLESCFREIQRVLKPGGRVVLFDYSLLKRQDSIEFVLGLTKNGQPQIFVDDTYFSMKAAFPLAIFRNLGQKYLPKDTDLTSTFMCPVLMMLRTHSGSLTPEQIKHFANLYNQLSPENKLNYRELVWLFKLNGLKNPLQHSKT